MRGVYVFAFCVQLKRRHSSMEQKYAEELVASRRATDTVKTQV